MKVMHQGQDQQNGVVRYFYQFINKGNKEDPDNYNRIILLNL
jgi:hypothetical protein